MQQVNYTSYSSLAGSSTLSATDDKSYSQSRKRQREEDTCNEFSPFPIFPHPCSEIKTRIVATPDFLIPRIQLPLSFLHPGRKVPGLETTRLISAHIKLLEDADPQLSSRLQPLVLIARIGFDDGRYAIERVSSGVYSIFRLGDWVQNNYLRRLASNLVQKQFDSSLDVELRSNSSEWWSAISLKSRHIQRLKNESEKYTSVGQTRLSHAYTGEQSTSPTKAPTVTETPVSQDLQSVACDDEQIPPEELLQNILQQYLDTLYLSETSIAYFVKGPLSRARGFFQTYGKLGDQSDSLCNLILNIQVLNKKYKDSIPASIDAQASHTGVVEPDKGHKRSTKLNRRKAKAGKNGLFPGEEEIICRWWRGGYSHDAFVPESCTKSPASRLARLQFRETLLQLTLILEALTIENSTTDELKSEQHQHINEGKEGNLSDAKSRAKSSRKPRDLPSLLDSLIDRLTIWQSLTSSDLEAGKNQLSSEVTLSTSKDADELKEFFREVLVPFYGSRLTEAVNAIGKKLGLTTASSPQALRDRKHSSLTETFSSHNEKRVAPGTELEREAPAKFRETLNRRSSEQSAAKLGTSERGKPLTLSRASTDSTVTSLSKRHSSLSRSSSLVASLQEDKAHSQQRSLSRSNSISQGHSSRTSLDLREVDLSAMAKFNEAKSRKKVDRKMKVENQLQDAIQALKKPNRSLACKEYVEAAEHRVANPPTKRTFPAQKASQNVQVDATPKRGATGKAAPCASMDVISTPQNTSRQRSTGNEFANGVSSSNPRVMCSTIQRSAAPMMFGQQHLRAAPGTDANLKTPSPEVCKSSENASMLDQPPVNPSMLAPSGAMLTPSLLITPTKGPHQRSSSSLAQRRGEAEAVFATPVPRSKLSRPTNSTDAILATPTMMADTETTKLRILDTSGPSEPVPVASTEEEVASHKERTIYETLGWNDDFDELA